MSRMLAAARFRELDKDNSGMLENAELHEVVDWVMQAFGSKLGSNKEEVKTKLMERIDANKDGKLDLEEFLVLFNEMLIRYSLMERAKAKFQELDTDKSGFLEASELDKVVSWSLEAFTGDNPDAYKAKLMGKIDANNDGKLDIYEFMTLYEEMLVRLELVQQATKKFKELDADKSGYLESGEIDKLVELVLLAYVEKPLKEREKFRKTLVDRIDKNKDGKLDLKEFTDLWEEMMARYVTVVSLTPIFAGIFFIHLCVIHLSLLI